MNVEPARDTCNAIMESLNRMSKAHITIEKRYPEVTILRHREKWIDPSSLASVKVRNPEK